MSIFDTLDSPPAGVRLDDPPTAKAAAESMDAKTLGNQRRQVLWAIDQVERHGNGRPGATAHEIMLRLAYTGLAPQQNVVVRRCRDLVEMGLAADTGLTRPGSSNREIVVWTCSAAGREAVAE